MLWWLDKKRASGEIPETVPDTPFGVAPALDLAAFGPVIRQNHIAYVPSPDWARVPGVGVANLAYLPDYLVSAPAWFAGNAMLRTPNALMIAQSPVVITHPKTVLEGVGGLTAGQMVHQPLLEVNINNGHSGVGE